VIGAVAIATGALLSDAITARSALADSKIPQSQAGYKSSPSGGNRCDLCVQFQPPSACKIVAGQVSRSGSCNFFAHK
jgi:hypothetical protein